MNNLIEHIFSLKRIYKTIIQIISDILIISFCFFISMLIRLNNFNFIDNLNFWFSLFFILTCTILTYFKLGFYKAIIRYISEKILITVGIAVFLSSLFLYLSGIFFNILIPRSIPFIYFSFLFLFTAGIRFIFKNIYIMYTFDKRIPVAIYGAGNTGRQILDYLNESLEYKPYFFIDDNKKLYKTKVNELYVFNLKDSTRYTEKYGIKTVIIANPKLSLNLKKSLIKKFEKNNIDVKTISSNNVFNSKEINISNISIQEILGREEIPAVEQLLNRNIQNKIVLITGAGGSIGTELCMQIIKLSPYKMICLDNSEHSLYNLEQKIYKELEKINVKSTFVSLLGSIQDSNFLKNILNEHKVSTIFHTAAYKHVPLIEENIIEGIKNNIFGTLNICNFSIQFKVQNFILISSDKAVRPTNFMGITKRISELICQSKSKIQNSTNFSIVRFGNVIGSSGSVIPKFQNQIENGGPVSVTHKDINRYFMTIREAAGLVIQASALGESGEVFVLDMGKPVKILDLAKKMIKLYGFNYSINTKQKDKILIEIVGLRKGEKISEELFISNKIFKTKHPRIYKSKEKNVIPAKLNEFLNKLQKYCNERNILLIKKHIKSLSNDFKI